MFMTECEYLDEGTPAKPMHSHQGHLKLSPAASQAPLDVAYHQIAASQNSLRTANLDPKMCQSSPPSLTQQSPRLGKRTLRQCDECGRAFPEEILSKHVAGCLQVKQKTPESQWRKRCYFNQVELDNH